MTIAPIPGGGGSGSVASRSADTLTAEAAFQNAVNQVKGTLASDFGPYNVVKYSSDHGDAVQTDINSDRYGRPQVEFTVDRYTHSSTVTELNPANGEPLTDPHTGKPYQEVITETPSGSFSKSGNLPTRGDSVTGFTVSLIKALPSYPVPGGDSGIANIFTLDNAVQVGDSNNGAGPSATITEDEVEFNMADPNNNSNTNPYLYPGDPLRDDGIVTLNTYNQTTNPDANGVADKTKMTSSYVPFIYQGSDEGASPSYFTSPPNQPFDWTHIFQPWTW